mgnify:CR=1 FL=1
MTTEVGFEEFVVKCCSCGKEGKIIAYTGYDTSSYVCQRCSLGEIETGENGYDS